MTTETKARNKNLSADFADYADLVFKIQVRTVFFNLRRLEAPTFGICGRILAFLGFLFEQLLSTKIQKSLISGYRGYS